MKKQYCVSDKVDDRIDKGSQRILETYDIRISRNGNKIYFHRKSDHKLRKVICITTKGFYDQNYRGFYDLKNGKPKYVIPKKSRWVLAYLRHRTKGKIPRSGWYRGGRLCRTRLVEFHIKKYKKPLLFFECQLIIGSEWDWKDPILYPFEISKKPRERIKQIRELFNEYHIPPKGIAKMVKIYSEQIGLKKPMIKDKRIYQIVQDLQPKEVSIDDIVKKKF